MFLSQYNVIRINGFVGVRLALDILKNKVLQHRFAFFLARNGDVYPVYRIPQKPHTSSAGYQRNSQCFARHWMSNDLLRTVMGVIIAVNILLMVFETNVPRQT